MLSPGQLATLKANILADPTLSAFPNTPDGADAIASIYNTELASPDFWVWRSSVSRAQIYNETGPEGTTWNWGTYRTQTVPEQNAWVQIFMGEQADFRQSNVRAGIAAIFTGSAPQTAQQAHVLGVGRRKGTRIEKLFAAGAGSSASPGVALIDSISYQEVYTARNLP